MKNFKNYLLVTIFILFAGSCWAQDRRVPVILDQNVTQESGNGYMPSSLVFNGMLSILQKFEDRLGFKIYDGSESETQDKPFPRLKISFEATQGGGNHHNDLSFYIPRLGNISMGASSEILGTELVLTGKVVYGGRPLFAENTPATSQSTQIPRDQYTSWVASFINISGGSYASENSGPVAEARLRRFVVASSVGSLFDQLEISREIIASRYYEEGGRVILNKNTIQSAPPQFTPQSQTYGDFGGPQSTTPATITSGVATMIEYTRKEARVLPLATHVQYFRGRSILATIPYHRDQDGRWMMEGVPPTGSGLQRRFIRP
jgi:hypothetical protein